MSSLKQISANYDYISKYEFGARARVMGYTLSFWVDDMTVFGEIPIRFLNIHSASTKFEMILTFKSKVDD
jgi:hypothetical protein